MISILIPTMNRSDFLIRALYYYSKVGFKGFICIGDSSNQQHSEKIKYAIKNLKEKINIIYRYFPKSAYIHGGMVMKELIELAPTPYAVFAGDDDFLIPNGLERCVNFLENHPEYTAAHGIRVAVRLKSSGAFGNLESANFVPQPMLEHETATERWAGYMRNAISTQYSVHRTETWRRMYRDVASVPIQYLGPELLPCSMSSILGKIKGLDCLSVVFQKNENRIFDWNKQSMYNLISHPDWSASIQTMRNCIVDVLSEKDCISIKEAKQIFDREFWHHVMLILQKQYWEKYREFNSREIFIMALKRFPYLFSLAKHLWKKRSKPKIHYKYENLISLKWLLNPASSFYTDFKIVYEEITTPPILHIQKKL